MFARGLAVLDTEIAGLRLLLVEDEYAFAFCLSDMLEDLGVQVIGPVSSIDDALDLVDRAPEIDAALLDVDLGGELSFPVADRLRAWNVPFAFASGHEPDLMPARFRDVPLFRKPLDAAAVRAGLAGMRPAA